MTETRGVRGAAYTLLTPDNHYASRLPNLPGASVVKLVTPRLAPARFGFYLVGFGEHEAVGEVAPGFESFLFGLAGDSGISFEGGGADLAQGAFVYLPPELGFTLTGGPHSRLLWVKRRYQPWPGLDPPGPSSGRVADLPATETATAGLVRRELIDPDQPGHDFNISLMSFEAGVGLPQIEIHDEEHGLYMTAGAGLYTLERDEHQVQEGDFIYMAPYCPQGFVAGAEGAEYLLYKDVYRDGF